MERMSTSGIRTVSRRCNMLAIAGLTPSNVYSPRLGRASILYRCARSRIEDRGWKVDLPSSIFYLLSSVLGSDACLTAEFRTLYSRRAAPNQSQDDAAAQQIQPAHHVE